MDLNIPSLRQILDLLDGQHVSLNLGFDVRGEGLGQIGCDHRTGIGVHSTGDCEGGSHLDIVVDEELEIAGVDKAGPLLDNLHTPGLSLLRTASFLLAPSLDISGGH